jgi:hypothetical protein
MVQSPSDYLGETSIIGQSLARSTKSLLESSYKCVTHYFFDLGLLDRRLTST